MLIKTKEGPATEPVSLQEAQEHLRWQFNEEHDLIVKMIKAATEYIENYTQRYIIQRPLTGYTDKFKDCMELAPDLVSITSIKYQDTDDNQQTLDASVYKANPHKLVGEVVLKKGQTWPSTYDEINVVEIEFIAGMAESEEDAPAIIKQMIWMMVNTWFDNRDCMVVGSVTNDMKKVIHEHLHHYRIQSVG